MKMKDKRSEQNRKKKEHLAQRKAAKRRKRGTAPSLKRNEPRKNDKETFLIVCEGENTEPSYFEQFKLTNATIKAVGKGDNTISLIKRAIQLSKEKDYDQVWCVFDKDDFPDSNFNNAIYKAEGNGFKVGYSNQAFEYWFILHFEDHQGGGMHRDDYCAKLNDYLKDYGLQYDCDSKDVTEELFDVLPSIQKGTTKTKQQIAIKRAKRIYKNWNNEIPAKAESSTTVFKLVEELEKYR